MANDIFNFDSPDLVNLQTWMKRMPREFGKAVAGVTNTMAFQTRAKAVQNIEAGTITRSSKFVTKSMRVDKAKARTNLNQIVSEVGSIDISGKGLSTGFRELETGSQSTSSRVPTLGSRTGGSEQRKVAKAVRFNKLSKMHRHTGFGRGGKKQRVAIMLRDIRSGKAKNRPFVIPRGLTGRLANMPAGVWKKKGKDFKLMNPFDGRRGKTKKLAWMARAVDDVTSRANLKIIWGKEIDFRLKMRK